MAAFEKSVARMKADSRYALFSTLRSAMVVKTKNRFLRVTEFAEPPRSPETFASYMHEFHHIPCEKADAYLAFLEEEGLATLR